MTPQYGQPAEPRIIRPGAKHRKSWWTLALIVGLILVCGAGCVGTFLATRGDGTTVPGVSGPADPNSIGNGIRLVPAEVKPGTYTTTVPAKSLNCYWARLKDTSGAFESILTNGNAVAGAKLSVTIAATDGAFESKGCGIWTEAGS